MLLQGSALSYLFQKAFPEAPQAGGGNLCAHDSLPGTFLEHFTWHRHNLPARLSLLLDSELSWDGTQNWIHFSPATAQPRMGIDTGPPNQTASGWCSKPRSSLAATGLPVRDKDPGCEGPKAFPLVLDRETRGCAEARGA